MKKLLLTILLLCSCTVIFSDILSPFFLNIIAKTSFLSKKLRFQNLSLYYYLLFFKLACAAANLAIGTLNGEQDT